MTITRQVMIFLTNGTKISVNFPKQAGDDPVTALMNVKKALEADRILMEVDGDLMIIPMQSVSFIQVSPAPEELPPGVIRNVKVTQ
jgi:hypothetical protein